MKHHVNQLGTHLVRTHAANSPRPRVSKILKRSRTVGDGRAITVTKVEK